MEEEINYSTVVFKNGHPPPKEKKEELVIYSEVKPKVPATSAPIQADGEAAAHSRHFCLLAVCLGILCVLLLGFISAVIYLSGVMNEQKANLSNLSAENQQLIMQRSILENKTEEMRRDRDNLNMTLGVIRKFKTFPLEEYCPEKKCQPCKTGWILFQKKCYLFYNEPDPWKTWGASQTYCKNNDSDLVVIDSLQEQEFISKHIKCYYDREHGYWIGLRKNNDNWLWVDGRSDTLKYWVKENLGDRGPCALMIPERNVTANWDPASCVMRNKFICEMDMLIWSNQS
ncbi:natural killer cells antigen CD94-like [Thunnus thynnus]|uniref:natural killer cells antigen CD94-like n=1 Tax=Thunnus thynnus TaxID=8237 RepID=UPI0035271B9B